MNRRAFLRTMAMAAGASASTALLRAAGPPDRAALARQSYDMPTRVLGRTGEQVSAIGLGGYHIRLQPDE